MVAGIALMKLIRRWDCALPFILISMTTSASCSNALTAVQCANRISPNFSPCWKKAWPFWIKTSNAPAQLIKSFKQVSEDQTGEQLRQFQLREYLEEILETLSPRFKQTHHRVEIDCAADLWLETLPRRHQPGDHQPHHELITARV